MEKTKSNPNRQHSSSPFMAAINHQLKIQKAEGQSQATPQTLKKHSLADAVAVESKTLQLLVNCNSFDARAPLGNIKVVEDNLYHIKLPHGQQIERSQPETLLHTLLQSHLRNIGETSATASQDALSLSLFLDEDGKIITPPQTSATDQAPADQHPPPEKRQKTDLTTIILGDIGPNHLLKSYHRDNSDFNAIQNCFKSSVSQQQHRLTILSGAKNNCWWRAAWASLLYQNEHHQLEGNLVDNIRQLIQHQENVPRVSNSFSRLSHWLNQSTDHRQFLTQQHQDLYLYPCNLKYPNESDMAEQTAAESDLAMLTFVILSGLGLDEEAIYNQIFDRRTYGEAALMTGLISNLGGTGIMLSKREGLLLVDEKKDAFNSSNVFEKLKALPVIKYAREHFDIYLPTLEPAVQSAYC